MSFDGYGLYKSTIGHSAQEFICAGFNLMLFLKYRSYRRDNVSAAKLVCKKEVALHVLSGFLGVSNSIAAVCEAMENIWLKCTPLNDFISCLVQLLPLVGTLIPIERSIRFTLTCALNLALYPTKDSPR